ncbi:hypothetical protein [Candidatus Purcelliella pentastirinorum]|uniref:hypothetical protein n=1 Tax=Candidatus Purcelliella pentastirinorum TaxID=472834 RepID=UPI0039F69E13
MWIRLLKKIFNKSTLVLYASNKFILELINNKYINNIHSSLKYYFNNKKNKIKN